MHSIQFASSPPTASFLIPIMAQCTEYGTVYSIAEIKAIAEVAHTHGMLLHMDGARLSNAAASLGVSLKEITVDCGVDMLSFGGTKNGLMGAEAIVFFKPELAQHFKFYHKQGMYQPMIYHCYLLCQ
jgi:threonine aldolase